MSATVRRVSVGVVWLAAIVGWQVYQRTNDLGTLETAQRFVDALDGVWWGPAVFTAAYLLRPLLLFPASLMTVAAGLLFGPVVGVLIVIVAANGSAMIAYGVGRALGPRGDQDEDQAGLIARWGRRLRERSFETVFVMRLLFLPYDLVNYAAGALRVRWAAFLLATVLGTLPGTVSFVLLGASIERLDAGLGGIDPWTVFASVAIFVVSLVVARLVRRSTADESEPQDADGADPMHGATATSVPARLTIDG